MSRPPHEFVPYPEGHAVKTTCVQCGHLPDHPDHQAPPKPAPLAGLFAKQDAEWNAAAEAERRARTEETT